ncbi:universal stress protein [Phenylobacterium sp.]|uniref:universal stress protein n=1 Tax=Phenylobacterium sp. TaxID=1871053 RepID=UPI0035B4D838
MFRDMLVVVDETEECIVRARTAAELAARWRAHLTGVFLTSDFLRQYMAADGLSFLPPDTVEQVLSDHAKAIDAASETARQRLEAAAGETGAKIDFMKIGGDNPENLIACTRRTDLTIMPLSARACLSEHAVAAARVVLASGGPALILPPQGYAPPVGKRVLVAWNGKREAARALRDAWPLIAEADEVHVLAVSPQSEAGPDGMLQRYLERHGCKANLIVDPGPDETAAEVIERNIAEYDADLLVMGLFGHSRLQELVLGGVSRHVLSRPPIPVFVSH